MYKIASQYLYILWNGHHNSNYHLSPYNIIKILLTIIPMLYITSLWLMYFIIGSLYLLLPFTYFVCPHSPSLWQLPVCSLYLWVCFCFVLFVLFFKIPQKSEIIWYLSFSVWLISLSIIPFRSIVFLQMVRFHSFFCLSNILFYTYTTSSLSSHLLMDTYVASIS